MALVLAGASSSFLATPVKADDDDRRFVRERHEREWRERRDHEWRERHAYIYEPAPYGYYAPPPVIYAPPPRPSVEFVFPLRIH
jgi:hypothetical protein